MSLKTSIEEFRLLRNDSGTRVPPPDVGWVYPLESVERPPPSTKNF
jgi:hypothetical protein